MQESDMNSMTMMNSKLDDWTWGPLRADPDLDEWLTAEDDAPEKESAGPLLKLKKRETCNDLPSDEFCDVWIDDGKCWFEEFPLFEGIQPLDESKNPDYIKSGHTEVLPPDQGPIRPSELYVEPLQPVHDLFDSTVENTTLVFSNDSNLVYIKSNPHFDVALIRPEQLTSIPSTTESDERILRWEQVEEEIEKKPEEQGTPVSVADTIDQDLLAEFILPGSALPGSTELSDVDELLINAAMELDRWDSDTTASETSAASPVTVTSSGHGDDEEDVEEMEMDLDLEPESDDPEWKPEAAADDAAGRPPRQRPRTQGRQHAARSARSRTATQEDKRLRKKEQNKCAATRYRLKKKAEVCELLREEEELNKRKAKLEERILDIRNEVKCLKGLMRDLLKAKAFK